jgi:uncharacterized protein YbjT (DUF2867 family)
MNIVLFGASGSAGGGVLRACLAVPAVDKVYAISRRPLSLVHKKLHVFIHSDYLDYTPVKEAFTNADACLFCLGISAMKVSGEKEYRLITHDFALAAARMLIAHSPQAVFHFISGKGSRLDSRVMWARVKAETERDLMSLGSVVCWRPAFIDGEASNNSPLLYKVFRPVFRLFKPFRSLYVSGQDLGRAMLQATAGNIRGRIIENAEIRAIAAVSIRRT